MQAPFGSGKTAVFAIGALQIIDSQEAQCQVLVLAPTHQLAQQTHKVCLYTNTYHNYGNEDEIFR